MKTCNANRIFGNNIRSRTLLINRNFNSWRNSKLKKRLNVLTQSALNCQIPTQGRKSCIRSLQKNLKYFIFKFVHFMEVAIVVPLLTLVERQFGSRSYRHCTVYMYALNKTQLQYFTDCRFNCLSSACMVNSTPDHCSVVRVHIQLSFSLFCYRTIIL